MRRIWHRRFDTYISIIENRKIIFDFRHSPIDEVAVFLYDRLDCRRNEFSFDFKSFFFNWAEDFNLFRNL